MTLQAIKGGLYIPAYPNVRMAWDDSTHNLTAVGYKVAGVFKLPPLANTTITHVGCRTGTVSGTGLSCNIGVYSVDASGDPSTNYGGSVDGTFTPTSNAFFEVALGTNVTGAAAGTTVAIVVTLTAGTTPNAGIASHASASSGNVQSFPYTDYYTTSWAHQTWATPIMWFKTADGVYHWCGMYPSKIASTSYASNSATNELALYFRLPGPLRVKGFWFYGALAAAADMVLYDSDGTTTLKSVSIVAAEKGAATGFFAIPFAATQTLLANTWYYLSLKPTTTTSITLYQLQVNSAAIMDQIPGGQDMVLITKTSGAWDAATTTKRPMIGLMEDQIDDGIGGGGGMIVHPGLVGGMRG